jgi:putative DNA modification/repair radical SAM protein
MEIMDKLKILSMAAKYDVSCSSSGSKRKNSGGIGSASACGICHSWSDDGRCISLLKILMTNHCIYDCAYCANRRSNDIPRAIFTPDELISLTINFYKRNYIEGLFISSGVFRDPDFTMGMMTAVIKKLRLVEGFYGYIHVKAIPGACESLVREAGLYADRMSVNIELPSEKGLKLLAPQKESKIIFSSMGFIKEKIMENSEERKKMRKIKPFVPAGQSTQVIIGATPESDLSIIRLSENLYNKLSLKRVYYSAYVPVNKGSNLPVVMKPPLRRENRLYQADWLLRFYGFKADEILDQNNPFLDEEFDPKTGWALRHLNLFPVEINSAEYEMILKIPGVGVISAKRIIKARRFNALNFDHLKKMGVVLKRARYFVTCSGKHIDSFDLDPAVIRGKLIQPSGIKTDSEQLMLFS